MSALDIAAEVAAALRSTDGASAIADAVRGVVAEEVRRALAESEADAMMDTNRLAKLLGCTPRALRQRLNRGSKLAAIARVVDGRKMWRRSEVMRLVDGDAPGVSNQ